MAVRRSAVYRLGTPEANVPVAPFNPIEMAFSKLKAFLKKTAARTVDDLWDAIAQGIETFTTTECQNYFAAAGYDRE